MDLPPLFIKGNRIHLTPISSNRIPLYMKWFNDPESRRFARREIPDSEEGMKEWIVDVGKKKNRVPFDIWHIQDQKYIGGVSLHGINWTNRNAYIGLHIGEREYWRHGIGTEVATLIVSYGFYELNLHKISAAIFTPNIGSQACAKKIGMKLVAQIKDEAFIDGFYYDNIIFSIFEDDWKKLHPINKYATI